MRPIDRIFHAFVGDVPIIQGGWPKAGELDCNLPDRRRFLAAVDAEAPEVLASLKADVFPAYRRAIALEVRFR